VIDMLTIRDEQMEALQEAAMRSFEQRMVLHLRQFFPEECRRAGEMRTLAAIRQGVQRAQAYGIESEIDVVRYIDISVVLGLDFDSGKRYPWARQILEDGEMDGSEKINALLDTMDYMRIRELDAELAQVR
jgi:hypothetical protein